MHLDLEKLNILNKRNFTNNDLIKPVKTGKSSIKTLILKFKGMHLREITTNHTLNYGKKKDFQEGLSKIKI